MADSTTTTENVIVNLTVNGDEPVMTKLANLKAMMIAAKAELTRLNAAFKAGDIDAKELAEAYSLQDAVLKRLTVSYNQTKAAATANTAATNTATAATKAQTTATSNLGTSLKSTNLAGQLFTSTLKALGTYMLAQVGVQAFVNGMKAILSLVSGFEHQMNIIKALTTDDADAFSILEKKALLLGKTTLYSATEVAKLFEVYSKLGFSAQEIIKVTEATLLLAQATGTNLAEAANIAGSVLRQFNLEADDMLHIVDVMAYGFNKSALDLENFGEAMKFVGPVANSVNMSLEMTTSLLMTLSNAGIKASIAGTSLRKMITDLAEGDINVFIKKLQDMAATGYTVVEAVDEVGRTAQTSALILSRHVPDVLLAAGAMKTLKDEAKGLSDIITDDLAGDWTRLGLAFQGVFLGSKEEGWFVEFLREVTQNLTAVFSVMNAENLSFFEKWVALLNWYDFGSAGRAVNLDKERQAVIDKAAADRQAFLEREAQMAKDSGNAELWLLTHVAFEERRQAIRDEILRQEDKAIVIRAKQREEELAAEALARQNKLSAEEKAEAARELAEREKAKKLKAEAELRAKILKEEQEEEARIMAARIEANNTANLYTYEQREAAALEQRILDNMNRDLAKEDEAKFTADLLAIAQKASDEERAQSDANWEKTKAREEAKQAWKDNFLQYTQQILTGAANFEQGIFDTKIGLIRQEEAALDAQLRDKEAKLIAANQVELDLLKQKFTDGSITEEEYNEQVLELGKELKEGMRVAAIEQQEERYILRKKEFEINKKHQIAQAIIMGAQAVLSAYTSLAGIPIVGPFLGAAAAVAAGVFAVKNIQAIRSTQFDSSEFTAITADVIDPYAATPPSYVTDYMDDGVVDVPTDGTGGTYGSDVGGGYGEEGGEMPRMANGGWFTIGGKRHSSGGTKFYGSDGTKFEAEVDEGLFILKREAHADFLREQSIRNQRFGGRSWDAAPVRHAALGGNVSSGGVTGADLRKMIEGIMRSMPRPVVSVESINMGQATVEVINSKAELM